MMREGEGDLYNAHVLIYAMKSRESGYEMQANYIVHSVHTHRHTHRNKLVKIDPIIYNKQNGAAVSGTIRLTSPLSFSCFPFQLVWHKYSL